MTKVNFDIDIDFADRSSILSHIPGISAKLQNGNAHNTGVYFSKVPTGHDGLATLDYKKAEDLGYMKLDLLNVSIYQHVRSETHLNNLMKKDPNWQRLWQDPEFCKQVSHVGNYHSLLHSMKPDSIPRMAMFLSVIRPAKKHLQHRPWKEIAETVWQDPEDGSYFYKKSHSISYAALVAVHINLLEEVEDRLDN